MGLVRRSHNRFERTIIMTTDIMTIDPQPMAIAELNRSEIDMQVATAKKYPRSIEKFRQDALSMATIDKETAGSCFYKLKRTSRDGESSFIEGPSVRLAEIVASAWGNLRFGARIISEDNRFVTAQGIAYDLERNVSNSIEVSRRITNKNGQRFNDDMIAVTKNAACSIALRNAIFKTVPFTYAKQIFEQAKKTAIGDVKTIAERRKGMIDAFKKMTVTTEQILDFCEKPSVEDIGLTEIENLIGVYQAIKDGDTTIEEQFKSKAKPITASELPPPQKLSAKQQYEKAKAILFSKKGKVAVEAILSVLEKDIRDHNDDELLELVKRIEIATNA
jgi:hypothetical protein